ncbi:hypothetical protein NN561_000442 [Cricetulus griseus]
MTVVSPGYSSFLITHIVDEKNALSMATMPHIITSTLYFPVNSWFLYNFGTTTGRTWNISVRPCNYWVQQDDNDVISPSIVKYIDMGNEENYEIKLMPITKGFHFTSTGCVGSIKSVLSYHTGANHEEQLQLPQDYAPHSRQTHTT